MDEISVRKNLDALREELARFDDERNVLVSLVRNYETWLRIHGKEVSPPPTLTVLPKPDPEQRPERPPKRGAPSASGPVSFRGTVLRVLREAHGEPLHAKEIWQRVEKLGGTTSSPHPLSVIALSIRGLSDYHPIEKAGPRTWRWTGDRKDDRWPTEEERAGE